VAEPTFRTTLPLTATADGFYVKPEFHIGRTEFFDHLEFDTTYSVTMKAPLYVPRGQELRVRIDNNELIVECVKC
jgi:hypothetical protein